MACNTASVHSLPTLRAALEPGIPVIGTVPAIKPAAAAGGRVAIWATPATTGSPYQRGLIGEFAAGVRVTEVPCPGLADAVEAAADDAVTAAVAAAAALTPADVTDVVLGCTHYELVETAIRAALAERAQGAELVFHGSAEPVAVQALRRIGARPEPGLPATGGLTVLRSGRLGALPAAALRYAEGRLLAGRGVVVG